MEVFFTGGSGAHTRSHASRDYLLLDQQRDVVVLWTKCCGPILRLESYKLVKEPLPRKDREQLWVCKLRQFFGL